MRHRIADLLAGAAGAGLFGYVLIRALAIPCTFDEGMTYVRFVRRPVRAILSPRQGPGLPGLAANNHLLNTLLAKGAEAAAGSSVAALRIPNVLAFVSYALFSWLVLRRLAPATVALAGFLALAGNIFVLDFFSLCRGYGLSLGFLAPGIWFMLRALEDRAGGWVDSAAAVLCLSLAMLASFPLLAPLLVVAAGVPVFRIVRERWGGDGSWDGVPREILPGAFILTGAFVVGLPYLAALSRADALYFGGTKGFVSDTVGSLVRDSLYAAPFTTRISALLPVWIAMAWAAVTMFGLFVAGKGGRAASAIPYLACSIVLDGTIVAAILARGILGSRYPISRTAIFFVPLFFFTLFGAIGIAARSPRPVLRNASTGVALAIAAAAVFPFASRANLRRPRYWAYDMDTPAMLDDLARMRATRDPIRLGFDPSLSSAINFYKVTGPMPWLELVPRIRESTDAKFFYLLPIDRAAAESGGFRLVRSYPETGNILLVRR
jgi:hypothetical protein